LSIHRGLALTALVLLGAAILAACSSTVDLGSPYAGLTPGPTPSARPGAYVWVVGAPDLVLGSLNGGASWRVCHRRSDSDIMKGDLWAVSFGDATHGWAVRRGSGSPTATVLATSDAGATWTWQYPGPKGGRLLAVAAVGATHAWAVGYGKAPGFDYGVLNKGLVIATSDGGTSWKRQHIPAGLSPYRVAFADARHGWLLAEDAAHRPGFVLSTSDGGAHWTVRYGAPAHTRLTGIAAVGTDDCWAVGYREQPQSGFVALTGNGGRAWTEVKSVSPDQLDAVSFPDARDGWAVGLGGTVVVTSDGGATWRVQRTGGNYPLRQVSFSDRRHGWALVGHLALLTTVDGGQSWSVVRPANTHDLLMGLATVDSDSVVGQ
jgi:photosystem II stability/assembly factor-like uncharacterized protein